MSKRASVNTAPQGADTATSNRGLDDPGIPARAFPAQAYSQRRRDSRTLEHWRNHPKVRSGEWKLHEQEGPNFAGVVQTATDVFYVGSGRSGRAVPPPQVLPPRGPNPARQRKIAASIYEEGMDLIRVWKAMGQSDRKLLGRAYLKFKAAVAWDPSNEEALAKAARVAKDLHKFGEARKYRQMLKALNTDRARELLREMRVTDPDVET